MSEYCTYCYHDEDLHEFTPDRRTPKHIIGHKYECSDCMICDQEKPHA